MEAAREASRKFRARYRSGIRNSNNDVDSKDSLDKLFVKSVNENQPFVVSTVLKTIMVRDSFCGDISQSLCSSQSMQATRLLVPMGRSIMCQSALKAARAIVRVDPPRKSVCWRIKWAATMNFGRTPRPMPRCRKIIVNKGYCKRI